jgi:hypothetical protein
MRFRRENLAVPRGSRHASAMPRRLERPVMLRRCDAAAPGRRPYRAAQRQAEGNQHGDQLANWEIAAHGSRLSSLNVYHIRTPHINYRTEKWLVCSKDLLVSKSLTVTEMRYSPAATGIVLMKLGPGA